MREMNRSTQGIDRRIAWPVAAIAVALTIWGTSCSLNSPSKTWKALDYEALEDAMAAPTGVIAEVSAEELLADIPPMVVALAQTIELYVRILELAKPPDPDGGITDGGVADGGVTDGGVADGGVTDGGVADGGVPDAGPKPDAGPPVNPGQETEGASVYFKLACPGPDSASTTGDFTFGQFRVDSPTLTEADIDTFVIRGHMLLSHQTCQTAVGTLTGESPAYFDNQKDWLGMQLQVAYQTDPETDPRAVDVGTIVDGRRFRLLLRDSQDRTYVLAIDLTNGVAVSLAGSDQVIGCEYTEDPPDIDCGADKT